MKSKHGIGQGTIIQAGWFGRWVVSLVFVGLTCSFFPSFSHSQTIRRWGNITGSPSPWFDVGGNWIGGVRPNADEEARFDQNAAYEVWWDSFAASVVPEVRRFWVEGGQVKLVNRDNTAQHHLLINESAPGGPVALLVSGLSTTLTLEGLHLSSSEKGMNIINGATLNLRSSSGGQRSRLSCLNNWLSVQSGAVSNFNGVITSLNGNVDSNGFVDIYGSLASWDVAEILQVGGVGSGTLLVDLGATVTSQTGTLGFSSTSQGQITVKTNSDLSSQWNVTDHLEVGRFGHGIMNIEDGSLVSSGSAELGARSSGVGEVNVVDRNIFSFARSHWQVAADLVVGEVGIGRLRVFNNGLVTVGGRFDIGNLGEVIFNTVESPFDSAPRISAVEGWRNSGVITVQDGWGILQGHITLEPGGRLLTTSSESFGATWLQDGLTHNGAEIFTAAGRRLFVDGRWDGAGHFTGGGEVLFSGELHPGNSADVINFAGDVLLLGSSHTFIELGGVGWGEYDRFDIVGSLLMDNTAQLSVNLIDGFELGFNQEFLIFNVGGSLTGQFAGLGEGDWVGNFGGRDLFITYAAGSGNSIALFTAIPEPSSLLLLTAASLVMISRRRSASPL